MKRMFFLLFLLTEISALKSTDLQFPLISSLAAFPQEELFLDNQPRIISFFFKQANSFAYNPSKKYFNDFELSSFNLVYREKLSPKIGFYAQLTYNFFWGGFLDRFIEKFHSTFGFPSAGREKHLRNAVNYYFKDYFHYQQNVQLFAPLLLMLSAEILQDENFGLLLTGGASIPLNTKPGFSSGRIAWLAGFQAEVRWKKSELYLQQLFAFFRSPEWLSGEQIKNYIAQTELALQSGKVVIALILRSSPYLSPEAQSRGNLLKVGFRLSPEIEIGLEEDLSPFDTSFDVAFYFCWRAF